MTIEEAIKRMEWMSWKCRSTGNAIIGGDDVDCLEMAISALREQSKVVDSDQFNATQRVANTDNALNGWISVEDRLPDLELVEVKINDTELYPCLAVIKNERARNEKFVGKVWYDGECFMNGIGEIEVVTHWMPLPEPPEVEV